MRDRNGDSSSHEPIDARVARAVAKRHGVFSYGEAVRMGITKRMVTRRLASRRWERLHPGVYRLAGAPETWHQQVLAACLAAGTVAAASHRAAAPLWRLAGFDSGWIEVTVPRGRRPRPRGVTIHQLPLPPVDLIVVDAIPTTTPTRTLLDIAGVAPAEAVEEALDDALRRKLVSLPRLRWRLDGLGRRPGAAMMRRLLAERADPTAATQSVLETRLLRVLRQNRLPIPIPQHEIRDRGHLIAVVDFAYPDVVLAIEADGYRWHSSRDQWQRDLARRSELARLGWRVIHVTADDLRRRPDHVARTVADALNRAAWPPRQT
jgi:very-short-patch-repair endonuclease